MPRRRPGATRSHSETAPLWERIPLLPLLLILVVSVGLYGSAVWLVDPVTLPVKSVRIESPLLHVKPQQLREAIGKHAAKGFLGVDVEQIRTELEALPWVRQASVRRGWPDRLDVRVEEQQPMARWADGGLVSLEGQLFRPNEEMDWTELPLLSGPRNTEQMVAKGFLEMQKLLTPLGMEISQLAMNERRSWDLHLNNGLRLGLGKTDINLRLLRFVRVYTEALKPQLDAIDSIDLRYTNGFAVRWRDGRSPSAA